MPKSLEDRIEERARQRVRDILSSGGVPEADIGKEILFLLPIEFVRMYQELWDLVFGQGQSPGGGGRDEGRIKRSGGAKGKGSEMKTRKMSGASGSGKRWKDKPEVVRSAEASAAKSRLDRKLVRAVETALKESRRKNNEDGKSGDETPKSELLGNGLVNHSGRTYPSQPKSDKSDTVENPLGNGEATATGERGNSRNRRCPECGSFQGPSWKRCPFH
jgi:hypothetical protein